MPKRINLETSGHRRSPRLIAKRMKLAALVTGVAVFLVRVSNAILPSTEERYNISFTQKTSHRYHTINSNADVTLNGILGTVFASVVDNDSYTYLQ